MPELPEVETMRRGVLSITGSTIRAAVRPPCERRPIEIGPSWRAFQRRVEGQKIVDVGRLGKRVVVELANAERIILEPRMTGLVLLADPPTNEHLRLVLELAGSRGAPPRLLFWDRRGLGSVRVVNPDEFATRYSGDRLGPDALVISADELRARLASSRRAIKVALLDQRALAGVGNLYASEILFLAAVHPATRCDRLRGEQWQLIHQQLRAVLELAIKHEGSTLSDGTYRNALNEAGGYQNHHRVYDRATLPCQQCGTPIERIVQAQRSTFFCPQCQSRRSNRSSRSS